MTTPLLVLVTAIYFMAAIDRLARGDGPTATILTGYVVANCGLIWLGLRP